WERASSILPRSRPSRSKRPRMPTIPHIQPPVSSRDSCAGSRRARGAVRADCSKHRLIALGAALNEEILNLRQVVPPDCRPLLGCRPQGTDGLVECLQIVQLNDGARLGGRKEISLTAAVVADHRQPERHRFQEHESEPLVLGGGY